MRHPLVNAFSIDVEEYFQVSAFEAHIARDAWARWPSRVEFATHRILDALGRHGIKATFFTLGWIAERAPVLLRRMVAEGHELACHGYDHTRIHQQDATAFRADLARSKGILEDTAGMAVTGYRAASFSIDARNLWAFTEIENAGFEYSSSIYPVVHDLYGMPDAPRQPFRAPNTARLAEIPVTTARFGSRNLPAGGGGYFRLFPYWWSRTLLRRVNVGEGLKANMYFHPWEFDPDQPRPQGLSLKTRFRHYVNQSRMIGRLERLFTDFAWGPFREVYADDIGRIRRGAAGG